jgi:hypothetical protein
MNIGYSIPGEGWNTERQVQRTGAAGRLQERPADDADYAR